MANKITKREVINAMLADVNVKANATYVAYLENELTLLDKKESNKNPGTECGYQVHYPWGSVHYEWHCN